MSYKDVPEEKMQEFNKLCELEPRLSELFEEAKLHACPDPYDIWYGMPNAGEYEGENSFKDRMSLLVGWLAGREQPVADTLKIGSPEDEWVILTANDLLRMHAEESRPLPNFPKKLCTELAYEIAYEVLYETLTSE